MSSMQANSHHRISGKFDINWWTTMSQFSDKDIVFHLIRNGNIEFLNEFLNKRRRCSHTLNDVIAQSYEKIRTTNVLINSQMDKYLMNILIKDRMIENNNINLSEDVFKTINDRLDFLVELVNSLITVDIESLSEGTLILTLTFIGMNINILKYMIPGTYDVIPWEEMDFCTAIFISNYIGFNTEGIEDEPAYSMVLHQEKFFYHLKNFSATLVQFQIDFQNDYNKVLNIKKNGKRWKINTNGSIELQMKNFQRIDVISNLEKSYNGYMELLLDYELVRNTFSLSRIYYYSRKACQIDFDKYKSRDATVLQRAIQVIGECLRNTCKSPNMSDEVRQNIVIAEFNTKVTHYLFNIRDLLSHEEFLEKRIYEIEVKDRSYFEYVQMELGNLLPTILRLLTTENEKAIRKFGREFLELGNTLTTPALLAKKRERMIRSIKMKKYKEEIINIPVLSNLSRTLEKWKNSKNKYMSPKQINEQIEKLKETNKSWQQYENNEKENLDNIEMSLQLLLRTGVNEKQQFVAKYFQMDGYKECFGRKIISHLDIIKSLLLMSNTSEEFAHMKLSDTVNGIQLSNINWSLQNEIEPKIDAELLMDAAIKCNRCKKQILEALSKESVQKLPLYLEAMTDEVAKLMNFPLNTIICLVKDITASETDTLSEENCLKDISDRIKKYKLEIIEELAAKVNVTKEHISLLWQRLEQKQNVKNLSFKDYLKNISKFLQKYKPANLIDILNEIDFPSKNFVLFSMNVDKLIKQNELTKLISFWPDPYQKFCEDIKNFEKIGKFLCGDKIVKDLINLYRKRQKNLFDIRKKLLLEILEMASCCPLNQMAIEMILLDMTEIAKKLSHFTNPINYYDFFAPLPMARFIRNYLAHGDTLLEVLPYPLAHAVLGNAEILASETFDATDLSLGQQYIPLDIEKLRKRFDENLRWTCEQEDLFQAAKEADFQKFESLVKKGSNIYGRHWSGQTIVHFALNKFQLNENPFLKFLVEYILSSGSKTTQFFEWILMETALEIDILEEMRKLCLEEEKYFIRQIKLLIHYTANKNWSGMRKELMFAAICKNSLEIFQSLYVENVLDEDGNYPIHVAVNFGCSEILEFLLSHDTKLKDIRSIGKKQTPIRIAAQNNQIKCIEKLIEAGANMVLEDANELSPIATACFFGYIESVKVLFNKGRASLNAAEDSTYSPLVIACLKGHTELAEYLVNNGAEIMSRHKTGFRPLHLATINGESDLVDLLIRKGAEVNATEETNLTPLNYAITFKEYKCAKILISNGGICNNYHGKYENSSFETIEATITPLQVAAACGDVKILELLIQEQFNINEINSFGYDALHFAVSNGYLDCVKLLLANGDFPKNGSYLMYAVTENHKEIAEVLIQNKFDVNAIRNNGLSVLHVACGFGKSEIVKTLIENGADINNQIGDQKDTPLIIAASTGHLDCVKILKDKGADINLSNKFDHTPLYVAFASNNKEIVEYLINNGADCNKPDLRGTTSVHFAAAEGHLEILNLLIKKDANLNAEIYEDKYTPLIYAANKGHLECVKILVLNGANIHQCDCDGFTALCYADHEGHREIAEFLKHHGAESFVKIVLRKTWNSIKNVFNWF